VRDRCRSAGHFQASGWSSAVLVAPGHSQFGVIRGSEATASERGGGHGLPERQYGWPSARTGCAAERWPTGEASGAFRGRGGEAAFTRDDASRGCSSRNLFDGCARADPRLNMSWESGTIGTSTLTGGGMEKKNGAGREQSGVAKRSSGRRMNVSPSRRFSQMTLCHESSTTTLSSATDSWGLMGHNAVIDRNPRDSGGVGVTHESELFDDPIRCR